MEIADQSFNRLLAQYVFSTAGKLIDSANPALQSKLIDLINRIDAEVGPATAADTSLGQSALDQLERNWQQVLAEPVDWQSVSDQWLSGIIRQRVKRHKEHITSLELAIQQTEENFQRVQNNFLRDPQRSRLIYWYERSLTYYQNQLSSAQKVYHNNLRYLHQLQSR